MAPVGGGKGNEKHQRHDLTLKQKFDVVQKMRRHVSYRTLAEDYKCSLGQLSNIAKNMAQIEDAFEENRNSKAKRLTNAPNKDINEAVFLWFQKVSTKGIPLSGLTVKIFSICWLCILISDILGPLIRAKALKIAAAMGRSAADFSASEGWYGKWRKFYNLSTRRISGEARDVDLGVVDTWMERIPRLIENYDATEIWNIDETGLFFRALPDRTLALKGSDCRGGKLAKERLTVLLACSSAGEKYKLLIVGKSENPRCFKGVKKSNLPAFYASNRKAWMTSAIFDEFMNGFSVFLQKRNRKAIVFMDNAPVHNVAKIHLNSNLKPEFLPANTTALTQPLDQGIIRAFKSRYRTKLLRRLISAMDSAENLSDLVKEVNVKMAIDFAVRAWNDLPESVIQNCFVKSGIWKPDASSDCEIIDLKEDERNELAELMLQLNFDENAENFVNFDADFDIFDDYEPEEEVQGGSQAPEDPIVEVADEPVEQREENVGDESPILTNREAAKALDALKEYAIANNLPQMMKYLNLAEQCQQDFALAAKKQSLITDFFQKV